MRGISGLIGITGIVVLGYWAWIAFLATWWGSAFWVARAVKRGAASKRIGYFLGFALGFALLFAGRRGGAAMTIPPAIQAPLVAIEIGAFGFAWWARLRLGRLWSGMLTLREGHRVVDTGPYALARHPIYTGFILAGWAFALATGSVWRLAGALVLTLVMVTKAHEEERWLIEELGAAEYESYRARTRMLVPWPKRDLRR